MKNTIKNKDLYKAYLRIKIDYEERLLNLEKKIDYLLNLSKECKSDLIRELKPSIVLTLKWKFDYLAKTLESPFEIESDIDHWIDIFRVFKRLSELNWFDLDKKKSLKQDVWQRTAEGFDFGWTQTTKKNDFENSKKIAQDRLNQIIDLIGVKNYFFNKDVLDSGCGPGRYIDLISKLKPNKIVGMDQGDRLISALKNRFVDKKNIIIEKGTCENLNYKDSSFDFILSNGVLHHTPSSIPDMIKDHSRVLRHNGIMFIMLVGIGGLELKIWEFIRGFLYDVPLKNMMEKFKGKLSILRMQGIVDHMYGEYQQTSRESFENICKPLFKKIVRVPGIEGLDVTPEIYANDPYFEARYGTGHLRYLCYK